jgi:aspartate/methionine/tyrosine aminotransferase
MANNNNINIPTPWSKKHKQVSQASSGGLSYSLSNSFAEPLTTKELIDWTLERGDQDLVDEYYSHSLRYTANGGSLDIREAIAETLYGPSITAANILVFPGAQVVLQTAARALVADETAHAITFTPGYQSVQEGPSQAGCGSVTKITLEAENGWQIDMAQVEAAIQENTRYIVLNEPYNPAGTLMSVENQTKLTSMAQQHGIYILCDEVYRLLEHNGTTDRLPAMADCYNKGISCVTLSKPWGGCGITIGWIACQDLSLIDQMSDLQYFGCACPSRASELQAIMTLRASDQILERNMKIILHNKALLEQFMMDYADLFDWVPPVAGAIAAIRFKGPLSSQELGAALAADAGISIKPAYCFTDEKVVIAKENDYFRVGFGESIMPAALDALRNFVDERKEEWRKAM